MSVGHYSVRRKWKEEKKRVQRNRLTANKKCSKTSVASFACNPCKSNRHSVRSSLDNLPSTSLLATPSSTPRPPPHTLPRVLRSPPSFDQLASRPRTACSTSLA